MGIEQKSGEIVLPATKAVTFAEIERAPSMIRALEFLSSSRKLHGF